MTTIFILGNKSDNVFELLFKKILAGAFSLTYFNRHSVEQLGEGYEISVFDLDTACQINVKKPIVLLKSAFAPRSLRLPDNATVIACSESERQMKLLEKCHGQVITCGFRENDTFSYTSIKSDSIVISLNREITALSGKKIQPLEIPLEIPKEADIYSLIAFNALRLMLDDRKSKLRGLYS